MKTTYECIPCAINQGINVVKSLNIADDKIQDMIQEILKYLSELNYIETTPPEVAMIVYEIIYKHTDIEDPFKKSKDYYNQKILDMEDDLSNYIRKNDDFSEILKFVISGNIIDFGAIHDLSEKEIFKTIDNIEKNSLIIDNAKELKEALEKAESVFYIGDNCGEIVFDKLFIKYLLNRYDIRRLYFGVRGGPIINDVTREDAKKVGMDEFSEIMDTGTKAPGVLLKNLKKDYKDRLFNSDLVISKGQGNYESLSGIKKDNVYFLFMAKCPVVASKLEVEEKSLICKKNQY